MSLLNIVEIILIIAMIGTMAAVLARFVRLPLAITLIFSGFIFSLFIEKLGIDTGIRAHNFQDLIFFVFLPALIFEAAYNINHRLLINQLRPILVLAIFGLLISTLLTAVSVYYAIGYGFTFIAALLTGALLSATDPVAVTAQLKELSAPKDLATLIEGESLFNDATAIVLFSILLSLATRSAASVTAFDVIKEFAITFLGGVATGAVSGLLAIAFSSLLKKFTAIALISLLTAYGSFYVAEHLLHVSGVMAVLLAAMIFGKYQQLQNSREIREGIEQVWEFLAHFFNTFLFIIMGIVITLDMFTERWLAILIAIAAVLVARLVSVYISGGVSRHILRKSIVEKYKPVLVWGGLRGAIAIALVLSLPVELEFWWTIQSMTFGVVLFSLLVQAPTNKWFLKKLKII